MQSHTTSLKSLAVQAFERGDFAGALAQFRAILAEHPGFADIRQHVGLCLVFLGDQEAALAEFDLALETNPEYVEAHLNRALVLQELGRYDEARRAFELAARHEQRDHPRFPAAATANLAIAHAAVGDLYQEEGAWDEAAAQFSAALGLRPRFHDIRNKYAAALLALDRIAEAITELERILDWSPRFVGARLNLGLALYRLGRHDEAAAEWQTCAGQEPDNAQVRAYLRMIEKLDAAQSDDG
jgi:tetratricopeptide (TPR) repeat protein